MLGGDHHRVHPQGAVLSVILHRDLGLAIRAQVVHQSLLADLGQTAGQPLGQRDGQRHQLGGLVAGVAEHHALVPSPVVQAVVLGALLGLQTLVHAHGDVGGLLIDGGDHRACVTIKAELGPVIADLLHNLSGDLWDVHITGGSDLPHHVDQAGGRRGLTGHPGVRVLGQDGVQYRI